VVDPFWGTGKEELTRRTCSTARCGRPDGKGSGGDIRGGGRQLAVLGAWSNRSERGRSGGDIRGGGRQLCSGSAVVGTAA
jgi:hypothetical protein